MIKKIIGLTLAGVLLAGGITVGVSKPAREWVKDSWNSTVDFFTNKKDQTTINELIAQVENLKKDKIALLAELTMKDSELSSKQSQLSEKQNLIAAKDEEIVELNGLIQSLNLTISQKQALITELSENAEANALEITRLTNEVNYMTENVATLTSSVTTLTSEKNQLITQVQNLTLEKQALESQISALNSQILTLTNTINALQTNGVTIAEAFKDYTIEVDFLNKVITIQKYSGPDINGHLIIPDFGLYVGEPFVTRIGSPYYSSVFANKGVTSITWPSYVDYIHFSSFAGNNIENLHLPNGIIEIGTYAFDESTLANWILPDTLERIGEGSFGTANVFLTGEFKLSSGLKDLNGWCFPYINFENSSNDKIVIPAGVERVNDYFFAKMVGYNMSIIFEGRVANFDFLDDEKIGLVDAWLNYNQTVFVQEEDVEYYKSLLPGSADRIFSITELPA